MSDSSSQSHFDKPVKFSKGQVLFCEGESSQFLYLVTKGEFRIVKQSQSRLIPIAAIRSGEFIGELSMFTDETRTATAIAVKNSEAILIKKSDIRRVIKTCPGWVGDIMQTLSERLKDSIHMLREHKIVDRVVDPGNDLPDELEAEFNRAIHEYKERRGFLKE